MDPETRSVLMRLREDARSREDWEAAAALAIALDQDEQFANLIRALRDIRALPCLDGSRELVCWMADCPRCIARNALAAIEQ